MARRLNQAIYHLPCEITFVLPTSAACDDRFITNTGGGERIWLRALLLLPQVIIGLSSVNLFSFSPPFFSSPNGFFPSSKRRAGMVWAELNAFHPQGYLACPAINIVEKRMSN